MTMGSETIGWTGTGFTRTAGCWSAAVLTGLARARVGRRVARTVEGFILIGEQRLGVFGLKRTGKMTRWMIVGICCGTKMGMQLDDVGKKKRVERGRDAMFVFMCSAFSWQRGHVPCRKKREVVVAHGRDLVVFTLSLFAGGHRLYPDTQYFLYLRSVTSEKHSHLTSRLHSNSTSFLTPSIEAPSIEAS